MTRSLPKIVQFCKIDDAFRFGASPPTEPPITTYYIKAELDGRVYETSGNFLDEDTARRILYEEACAKLEAA